MQATLTTAEPSRPLRVPFEGLTSIESEPRSTSVALILNRNARKVNDKVAQKLAQIVGDDNLFYSRTIEDAETYSREIVRRGYGTVVCGGGDGTLTRTVNLVRRYVAEANECRLDRLRRFGEWQKLLKAPRFAFLRLGTGNALSTLVGAGDPASDLLHIMTTRTLARRTVPMVNVGDEHCFFAGVGYDSLVLEHYNWLRERTQNPLARPFMHSLGGYFAAIAGRTLPSLLCGKSRLTARVKTRAPAYYVNPRRGDALEEMAAGTVLYEGPAAMIGVGTTPYYGYGLRVYPFAGLVPDMMQLRIANMGALRTLANLSGLWRGSYRAPELLRDFMVSDVEVELDRPFAFQHSGDAQGLRQNMRWTIAADQVELIELYPRGLLS